MKRDVEGFLTQFGLKVPDSYKSFLQTHDSWNLYLYNKYDEDEKEEDFCWTVLKIASINKGASPQSREDHLYLDSDFSIAKKEPIPFFKAMKYFRECFEKDFKWSKMRDQNDNDYSFDRFEGTICIGKEWDGDSYLLLDPTEKFAVYIAYHDAAFIEKIAESFEEFISRCRKER